MVSNEELFYSFEIHNLRGPAIGNFNWSLELIDSSGAIVDLLDDSSTSTYARYGQLVLERSSSTFIDPATPSGIYSCRVMVNIDRAVDEFELFNNEVMSENFTIQNEDELWANDVDRDGYNTTDTGDGIVDDCPDKYGESWGDRYGCADLDGDGWSNLNDFSPLDESQWVDEDEDGFGDNSSGFLGDQCPGVAGVENGEGGDGCPPPFVDTDGDGVQNSDDDCSETPQGASVDENGCELDTDGDGIADSLDNCPETVANSTVDDAGCEVVDTGGSTGDTDTGDSGSVDNSETEGEATTDSAKSGTNVVMFGGISAGVLIIIILTLLIVRKSRSNSGMVEETSKRQLLIKLIGRMVRSMTL